MQKFVSIKEKFIRSVMIMISAIFAVLLGVIITMNISSSNKNLKRSEQSIRAGLIARGRVLVGNNSNALRGMALDNAFTAIQELVAVTVAGDVDIVRGIYMDSERHPFSLATNSTPSGVPTSFDPLTDSVDIWASELIDTKVKYLSFYNKDLTDASIEIIEFGAPVKDGETVLGFIRYSISTASLDSELSILRSEVTRSRTIMILILLLVLGVVIIISLVATRQLAFKITDPIEALVKSANLISGGDYSIEIKHESSDEIGNLAYDFEVMRKTIKKHTEHLNDIIDEKMQQVKDILNNIDQGLFTVNFDGTVNEEYSSRANRILKVGDVSAHKIYELLRLDKRERKSFDTWIGLLREKHDKQRWKKLVRLAPVHDLELSGVAEDDPFEFISVSYQKIYDKDGKFTKLMVLTQDETEKREKERQIEDDKNRHDNEVSTILGIANTPEDELTSFINDSRSRLNKITKLLEGHLACVTKQRKDHPLRDAICTISPDSLNLLYRDIHTMKGNGGSYGFQSITEFAHCAEDQLDLLKEPLTSRRGDVLGNILGYTSDMSGVFNDIDKKIKLIYGREEDIYMRVAESSIKTIQRISNSLKSENVNSFAVENLINEVNHLSWKPFKSLARKYQKNAIKIADELGKDVDFNFVDENTLHAPEIFSDVDEIILHLVRNCVDHGIESPEDRVENGKGRGVISFAVKSEDAQTVYEFSDDGAGIDVDVIVKTALLKGVITKDELSNFTELDIVNLIFSPGFTTSKTASTISGRGIGMDIVKEKVDSLGGTIEIKSKLGIGTTFRITLPIPKRAL
jgi:two-component system chemotaxis sensor kinase CheA